MNQPLSHPRHTPARATAASPGADHHRRPGRPGSMNQMMPPPPARSAKQQPQKKPRNAAAAAAAATTNNIDDSVIASSLLSGSHGRQRRRERQIQKTTLQMARRYGMKEENRFGREKYTYQGVSFIYDPVKNKEVTSFRSSDDQNLEKKRKQPDHAAEEEEIVGTRATVPILLSKRYEYETSQALEQHQRLRQSVCHAPHKWSSHSVLCIDMSGSMRADDCSGARCRSDGVFMALARDFVGEQLEERAKTGGDNCLNNRHQNQGVDVVSVVLMINNGVQLLLQAEPLDWTLYNRFVDYREWSNLKPGGHGCYLPALDAAEKLLLLSADSGACALSLLFFSDGRPSDGAAAGQLIPPSSIFAERVGRIAARFGRRLTIQCIGMAANNQDHNEFAVLEDMVREASAYGAIAAMGKPKLTQPHSLTSSIRTMVSSMTQCKTTLTHPKTGLPRRVRTDLLREKMGTAEDEVLTSDWQAFHAGSETHYLQRVWRWNRQKDAFDYIMDPRCIYCYKLVASKLTSEIASSGTTPGACCPDCKACFICNKCAKNPGIVHGNYQHRGSSDCRYFLEDRRHKAMVESKNVPSFSVAMKKLVFGEGAERLVRQFRYLDDKNNFVGPKWVAKESRFVDEEKDSAHKSEIDYHRDFMRSQMLAHDLAAAFNKALDDLPQRFEPSQHDWLKKLPRIRFVEPLVVELVEGGKKKFFLVESMLEGRYRKFNNNMGYVFNTKRTITLDGADLNEDADAALEAIAEDQGEGDSGESETSQPASSEPTEAVSGDSQSTYKNLRVEDFPQAFSHWSYVSSKKQLLVVDLQGVLQTNNKDGTCEYLLTDPAIHKRASGTLGSFGQTDRGKKGMNAFWKTHVCTAACSLLGLEKTLTVRPCARIDFVDSCRKRKLSCTGRPQLVDGIGKKS